ncbi:MAG: ABC transporter ATP-binding protein [Burkholderiaceae bacterium]
MSRVYVTGSAQVRALDGIDLAIDRRDYLALVGTSGSGKSTLLNLIGGIDKPSAGEIRIDGERIDDWPERRLVELRRHRVAYVFQDARLAPTLTAAENVSLPAAFSGARGMQPRQRALELLDKVGLAQRAEHLPHQLSGGEAQRVCIARALFNRPALVLADEPTGNLDHDTRLAIVRLFESLNDDGHAVVMVTHDPEIAGRARRRVVLQDGRVRTA